MNYIDEIKNVFSQPNINIRERVKIVEITFETTTLPKYDDILLLINKIPSRDIFQIVFEDDSEERIVWGNSLGLAREEYDQYVLSSSGDSIMISISIKKSIEDNTFSIYCFDEFMKDLNDLSLFDVLCSFSNLLYEINEDKFRLQYSFQRQEVTGLIVNTKVSVSERLISEIENAIYYCSKYGVMNHMARLKIDKGFYKEHLYGIAYFVKMVNKEKGEKYLSQLDDIDWPI